jgi:hypothetical protein
MVNMVTQINLIYTSMMSNMLDLLTIEVYL